MPVPSLTLALVVLSLISGPEDEAPNEALTPKERIVHVLNRFGLGARGDQVHAVQARGLEAWLEEQLLAELSEPESLVHHLSARESLEMTTQEIIETYDKPFPREGLTREKRRELAQFQSRPPREVREAVLLRSLMSRNVLHESLNDFFRNHFNVASNKDSIRLFMTEWEREVIRKHSLGSFSDLLIATAHHPAMLVYLDNAVSRRPPNKQELREIGQRVRQRTKSKKRALESIEIAKQSGLNENYARELLELHTLGADNYYKQKDVVNVALALTGWTVEIRRDKDKRGEFQFRGDLHDDRVKYFLGRRIPQKKKVAGYEGEWILRALVKHKGTSHYLATKLCRHFVNDQPDPDMVERLAKVFHDSKGDMQQVIPAMIEDPEFFARRNYMAKFKRPSEFLISAIRCTGAQIDSIEPLFSALRAMNEQIYLCEDPTGYYDQAEAWQDAGVMVARWRFAMRLARGEILGIEVPDSFFEGLHPDIPHVWANQIADRVLPGGLGPRTRRALVDYVKEYMVGDPDPDPLDLGPNLLGMLLGSPEFQKQ